MKSRVSIKNINLPEVPRPATKPIRDDRFQSVGNHTVPRTNSMTHIEIPKLTEERKEKIHRAQLERKLNRWNIVERMLKEGATYAEIAEATGYSLKSMATVVKQMKKAGRDIPPVKQGRPRK